MRSAAAVLALLALGAPARAEIVERIVAVVNTDAILLSELRDRMQPYMAQLDELPSRTEREARSAQVEREALGAMVDELLISQQARSSNVTVTAEEVDRAIRNVMRANNMSREQFEEALLGQGMTIAQYTADVRRQLLALKVLNARVRGRINITAEDVRDAYNQTVRQIRMTATFEGAHILLRVAPGAGPREVAAARSRAEEALRLARRGDSFADLARRYSDDAETRENGGSLGSHGHGELLPALDDAFLDLDPDEVAASLVRTPEGFHVVKLLARDASEVQPLAAVRDSLYQQLLEREMARQQRLWLKELRRKAYLEIRLGRAS